ncbi:hypothetical protein FRC06_004244 [Ceratobasidium sp. 370]|nr:hypothetical protein FRC06_004244 [Ceratobasidium sp. 370]
MPSGLHELAVNSPYLSLSPGSPEPSRPSSAAAPIHGCTNRIPMSATSVLPSLPTPPTGPTPLGNGLAQPSTGLSSDPLMTNHADGTPTMPRPNVAPLPIVAPDSGEGVRNLELVEMVYERGEPGATDEDREQDIRIPDRRESREGIEELSPLRLCGV